MRIGALDHINIMRSRPHGHNEDRWTRSYIDMGIGGLDHIDIMTGGLNHIDIMRTGGLDHILVS